jgi:protein KTI12
MEHRLKDPSYEGPLTKVIVLSDDHINCAVYDGRPRLLIIRLRPVVHHVPLYPESQSEKAARGVLFAALRRQLALDTVLIVDAMNYIKGFRYQMYCAAREMKLRCCTVRLCVFCAL